MKTFLSVLYRRILYKVPLKWLLILIAIFGLLFASFSSANYTISNQTYTERVNDRFFYATGYDLVCVYNINCTNNTFCYTTADGYPGHCTSSTISDTAGLGYCSDGYINLSTFSNCSYGVNLLKFDNYTSLQCQTEYNLIPISSVDQSYCTSNNLCPSGGTPSDCPNLGVSNLWINDLFHPGAFNIIMNIPEEIDWDYAYTNSGNNLNIDVVGYNVDYEAVQSVIDQQNYKPTQEDFQNLILILGPYGKIIIFFVFLFILWAWIKKPFKSKL